MPKSSPRDPPPPIVDWPGTGHDAPSLVWFPGGRSHRGTDWPEIASDGEAPPRPVRLKAFAIDRHAVSNARFAAFVADTGYRTDAERFGWSFVFQDLAPPSRDTQVAVGTPWWHKVDGAFWSSPEGPGSTIAGRERHPVVHVSWNDAVAFARWCGLRLPTEAEWEHAARGGPEKRRFPWGNDEPQDGPDAPCNIWQGSFPTHNARGRTGTMEVDALRPNPVGLFNCTGNVWQWCADAFRVRSLAHSARQRDNEATRAGERVMKGGSYLCHRSYCYRYRIAARTGRSPDTSAGNIGFRLAGACNSHGDLVKSAEAPVGM